MEALQACAWRLYGVPFISIVSPALYTRNTKLGAQLMYTQPKDKIRKLEEMGAAPTVFTLHPGEFVHINKGRLHAFRRVVHFKPYPYINRIIGHSGSNAEANLNAKANPNPNPNPKPDPYNILFIDHWSFKEKGDATCNRGDPVCEHCVGLGLPRSGQAIRVRGRDRGRVGLGLFRVRVGVGINCRVKLNFR